MGMAYSRTTQKENSPPAIQTVLLAPWRQPSECGSQTAAFLLPPANDKAAVELPHSKAGFARNLNGTLHPISL
jgi:hypothetical protein